jgi:3-oxoacyl-[acyl-carrier protein] reductase
LSEGRLQGRAAIVTGASGAMGRAISVRLAREGAHLVLAYNRSEEAAREVWRACREAGAEVFLCPGDLTEEATAQALVDAALERIGSVEILVNNAAQVSEGLLVTLDEDEIQAMVQTNVLGLVRLSRAALKPMLRCRQGSIINVSSVLATRPGRGNAVYAGTKGFVESFTRALAVEVGRKGVRVNAVAPGVIEAGMGQAVRSLLAGRLRERVALDRLGRVEEVAAAVAYLASDEASYVSGAVLAVDGAYGG